MNASVGRAEITVRIAAGVASIEIDNRSQRNAVTRDMCLQLQTLLPRLDADPEVSVITLRGAGDTFSAGAAIGELPSILLDEADDGSRVDQLSLADAAIVSVAKPTIAFVDGACMGGGWQLASACDFILASEGSVFAITPAKLGVLYPRAGIERLVRQVGSANSKYILFSGETFSAERARELGLVTETVADDRFDDRCKALVTTLLHRSRFSLHTLKHLVDLTDQAGPAVDREWDDAWTAMTTSGDFEVGVAAFLAREHPRFVWQP